MGAGKGERGRRAGAALLGGVLLALVAMVGPVADAAAKGPSAVIRRSAHGIPHIVSKSWEGIGYGYGYAFAQDDICPMADDYVTVRAQRSRFFGPDATYAQRGNGTTPNNLNSDFFFQRAINTHIVEKLIAEPPPRGPLPVVKQTVKGYVKGYDRFLKDTGVAHISDPSCRGKSWVRPITELDAYRRFWQLGLLASQGVALDGIGGAQPPPLGPFAQPSQAQLRTFGARMFDLGIGSNAVALGGAATRNGRGLMLGNPHFPWDGTERFYEAHATIPGKVNVIGGSRLGPPAERVCAANCVAARPTRSSAVPVLPF